MGAVVRGVQVCVGDYRTGIRRMDEAPVPRINTYMVDATLRAAEEQQVAGLQIVPRHLLGGLPLVRRGPRHLHAHLIEAEVDEAAAIEALLRAVAAIQVGRAEIFLRDADDSLARRRLGLGRNGHPEPLVRPAGYLPDG